MPTYPTLGQSSMKVYGSLASEAIAKYPTTIARRSLTRVITFLDDSEQRWSASRDLAVLNLEYRDLDGYTASVLLNFFYAQRGMAVSSDLAASTFDIDLDGVNYQYCVFDHDEVTVAYSRTDRMSFTFRIRQLRPND